MRVELADSTGCPCPQIVLYAETVEDQMFLKLLATFEAVTKEKWVFQKHGVTFKDGKATAMNIGFAKADPDQKELLR